jgi:hypothetical protein
MSLLSVIARGIYHALGIVMGAGELLGAGRKLVREARKGTLPHAPDEIDRTEPIPLTQPSRLPAPPRKPKLVPKGPLKMR